MVTLSASIEAHFLPATVRRPLLCPTFFLLNELFPPRSWFYCIIAVHLSIQHSVEHFFYSIKFSAKVCLVNFCKSLTTSLSDYCTSSSKLTEVERRLKRIW